MAFVSLTISVHSAPRGERGQDAAPCEDERVLDTREDMRALVAVLDGCGGTGARRYLLAEGWSGARLASHLAGRRLCRWFSELNREEENGQTAEDQALALHDALEEELLAAKDALAGEGTSRISSRLSKELPTTLAALTAEAFPNARLRLRSFWAGNSRNYVLLPRGLRQLSRDDLVGGYDPWEDLSRDGVLSNSVNASVPFVIHAAETEVSLPCLIFSATDGVFSYFDSPIRLEWLLLSTLREAESPLAWENALREEFGALAADDHTLQLAALGFESFAELQKAYAGRLELLEREYIPALQEAAEAEDSEQLRALWERYKTDYFEYDIEKDADHG